MIYHDTIKINKDTIKIQLRYNYDTIKIQYTKDTFQVESQNKERINMKSKINHNYV